MKKIIILSLIFSITYLTSMSQSKKLSNITSFKLRNSGAISDDDQNIQGYYFFYKVDKLKKGKREFAIQILDNDLNVIATKSIIGGKNMILVDSDYNNKEIAFLFMDYKEKLIRYVTFDKSGNKAQDINIPTSKKTFKWMVYMSQSNGFDKLILPVKDKGFVVNLVQKEGKLGYKMTYYPSDKTTSSWSTGSPEDSKKRYMINPIEVSSKYIVSLETSIKGLSMKNAKGEIVVLNSTTGKELFRKDFLKSDVPKMVTNAFEDNDDIVILGEYYAKGTKNIYKAKSLGLSVDIYDSSGNLKSTKEVTWNNKIIRKLGLNGKNKKYVFFHEIVKTKSGEYVAIGEEYKKTANAGGVALAVLSAGRTAGAGGMTQLTITDAVTFVFNKDFELIDAKEFKKGKSRAPNVNDFGSPQVNAFLIKQRGGFDFTFLQMDPNKNRFYANFIDYEREGKHKGERAFKSIIYNDGVLSEDKIYLKKNKRKLKYSVLPAKLGYVLIVEKNKKEKTIDLHLEKLNIE